MDAWMDATGWRQMEGIGRNRGVWMGGWVDGLVQLAVTDQPRTAAAGWMGRWIDGRVDTTGWRGMEGVGRVPVDGYICR